MTAAARRPPFKTGPPVAGLGPRRPSHASAADEKAGPPVDSRSSDGLVNCTVNEDRQTQVVLNKGRITSGDLLDKCD